MDRFVVRGVRGKRTNDETAEINADSGSQAESTNPKKLKTNENIQDKVIHSVGRK